MDYLWTPWRYAYITAASKDEGRPNGCIFCELPKLPDEQAKIVYRGKLCYVILNSFPYTSGHVMIVPFAHLALGDALLIADLAAPLAVGVPIDRPAMEPAGGCLGAPPSGS